MSSNFNLSTDLDRLQNHIKHDNFSYKEEFLQQFFLYRAYFQLILHDPKNDSKDISKLILFLSSVIHFYEEYRDEFSNGIFFLLKNYSDVMNTTFIHTLAKSIIIMRNNKVVAINDMIELFFRLFTVQNKSLRKFIYTQLIYQICKINYNRNALKSPIQSFFYSQFPEKEQLSQYLATEISIELYKKNIWRNLQSVHFIQNSVFSDVKRISINSVRFFINPVYENISSESSEEEDECYSDLRNRKTKGKQTCSSSLFSKTLSLPFYAIDLIRDPFNFTTILMKLVENKRDHFDHLLEKMSMISLLIWSHKLIIPQFYTFIQPYLRPHQHQVTHILTYLSQGTHETIEPSLLESVIQAIISNFITERNSSEIITVGLNTIREIAVKCPNVLNPELLSDLVEFRKCKNKNVIMAARSLLQLYRYIQPELLRKSDRGKPCNYSKIRDEIRSQSNQPIDFIPDVIFLDNITTHVEGKNRDSSEFEVELAREISQSRILTQIDHRKMKLKRTDHLINPKLSNRQLYLNYRMMKEKRGILTVSEIEHLYTKPKRENVHDDVDKSNKLKLKLNSGLSKNAKRKKKNYMMICHGKSVVGKKIKATRKSYLSKNYKLKRILRKEYRRTQALVN